MQYAHDQERISFIFSIISQFVVSISHTMIEGYDGKDKVYFYRCMENIRSLVQKDIIFLVDSSFCLDSQLKYINNMQYAVYELNR